MNLNVVKRATTRVTHKVIPNNGLTFFNISARLEVGILTVGAFFDADRSTRSQTTQCLNIDYVLGIFTNRGDDGTFDINLPEQVEVLEVFPRTTVELAIVKEAQAFHIEDDFTCILARIPTHFSRFTRLFVNLDQHTRAATLVHDGIQVTRDRIASKIVDITQIIQRLDLNKVHKLAGIIRIRERIRNVLACFRVNFNQQIRRRAAIAIAAPQSVIDGIKSQTVNIIKTLLYFTTTATGFVALTLPKTKWVSIPILFDQRIVAIGQVERT